MIAAMCSATDGARIEAEVVGFAGDRLFLMPTGDIHGLKPNARVIPRVGAETVAVGEQLLGRVIDGAGQPLDGLGPLNCPDRVRLTGVADQSAGAPTDQRAARCRRAHDQFVADGRSRSTYRFVRGQRRR